MSDDLAAVRTRWNQLDARPLLNIGLLASYTIDPVLPYLGVALHDAGLPAAFTTGPYNQIVQQCLDDSSEMALVKPDVLVVAPRFEELGDELLTVLDTAVAAARRWGSFLVVVLPAVPEDRAFGHLDDGRAAGTAAAAHVVREEIRGLLAVRPDAWLVDAEQAVRMVGSGKAHHPAMYKFAKIPYTEAVFAELAGRLAGVLRAVYGATPRVVVVDGDSVQDEQLRRLHASGARIALRAGPGDVDALWEKLSAELVEAWVADCRPIQEQLSALAEEMGIPAESAVLLTVGSRRDGGVADGAASGVQLGAKPDAWPAELLRSGLLDRLPAPETTRRQAVPQRSETSLSLEDFVAGLNVEVTVEPITPDSSAKVVEVVSRAKDFTLGTETLDLSEDREVFAIKVRDRFGDYGIGGAVGIRHENGKRVVDVFSLSCVVLGKGVQDSVFRQLAEPGEVVFRYRPTPNNQITAGFLTDAGATIEEIP